MKAFLVDLTHGGVKISSELAKRDYEVFAYDLYGTLKSQDEDFLKSCGVEAIKSLDDFKEAIKSNSSFLKKAKLDDSSPADKNENLNNSTSINNKEQDLDDFEKDLIINPIHSSLNIRDLLDDVSNDLKLNADEKNQFLDSFEILNHHSATRLVLSAWREKSKKENVDCIELTGVKGKTSVASMLKYILLEDEKDTLLLSSLGAHLFKNSNVNGELENSEECKDIRLLKNISITPANIINTIQYAGKIVNPKCSGQEDELENRLNYNAAIFENSLGVCGLGDIAVLTNIVENYPIAKGSSNAREAKKQVFYCPLVVIEAETLNEHYPEESDLFQDKINTFSISDDSANVYAYDIDYRLNLSEIKIRYHDLKVSGSEDLNEEDLKVYGSEDLNEEDLKVSGSEDLRNGEIIIKTFAPGRHHVLNALTALTAALSLGIDEETIQKGLRNFKGIEGRTHVRREEGSIIIEEINPGINTKAIESSINMIKNMEEYYIIIGGRYGITCEEIDEDRLSHFLYGYLLENPDANLILTDELGLSIKKQLDEMDANEKKLELKYIENYEEAQNKAMMENKNILFIYRSNYSQISKR